MDAAPRVYLDYNATAPLRPCARAAMQEAMARPFGNPSSLHEEGRRAFALLDEARQRVASLVGATPGDVIFTSGGTEAVNAMVPGHAGPPRTRPHVVVGATDHACVLESARAQELAGGRTTRIPVDQFGRMDLAALGAALADGATCVLTHWANNETGVLQDVESVGTLCAEHAVPLMLDAVQVAGKLPIDFAALPAQALALSAHKIGGPQGVGAVVLRPTLPWRALLRGGHQEHDRRGGTEPVLAAVGFGAAAAAASQEAPCYAERVAPRRDELAVQLRRAVPRLREHGERAPRIANTLNVRFPGWHAETLVQRLDLEGISAGTGAACAAGAAEPSHVLMAMGLSEAEAAEAVRFSLGFETGLTDVQATAAAIARLAAEWGVP